MNENYQKELDRLLDRLPDGETPTLLLHSCCAPCSSYVLEYLSQYFQITVYYYNPNMDSKEEYEKRTEEQQRLIKAMFPDHSVAFLVEEYHPEDFFEMVKGLEREPEGGRRCYRCYELRLQKAAQKAAQLHMDYFTTTLSISPLKNAVWINELCRQKAVEMGISYLPSDFKKRGGYQRSIELSREYNLYRQNFCGCIYSKGK